MSAYEVGFSVSDGVIDVSVVVPGKTDVTIDGSAYRTTAKYTIYSR